MDFLSQCTSGGCGARIESRVLNQLLQHLPEVPANERLLVGFERADDTAVYQIAFEKALISTVDFFSPMVNDPLSFGKITVTNALNDVYAMGGAVLYAPNFVCFPQKMSKEWLEQMLLGGSLKLKEADALPVGDHSIYGHKPKYGLAVTGEVHPENLWYNNTPQVGDVLILTEALGIEIIQAAVRGQLAKQTEQEIAQDSMERLNKYVAVSARSYTVYVCTDMTGFGLLIHAKEMADNQVTLPVNTEALLTITGTLACAAECLVTTAGQRNRQTIGTTIDYSKISMEIQELLFDPQTSGGLLVSVIADETAACLAATQKEDPVAKIIGEVLSEEQQAVVLLQREGPNMKLVDALGKPCPMPVIETKKALAELGLAGGTIEVLVDNEVATENSKKLVIKKQVTLTAKQIETTVFSVKITVPEEATQQTSQSATGLVIMVGSDQLGTEDEQLGRLLMKSYLKSLSEAETVPIQLLFFNRGAFLTNQTANTLADLQQLAGKGATTQTCGACSDFYHLTDTLATGSTTNMYEIAEAMDQAAKVIML